MMRRQVGLSVGLLSVLVLSITTYAAASERALAETEGRRRAAENGARSIKSEKPGEAARVAPLYNAAADANNAWVDRVCSTAEQGAATTDAASLGDAAAARLIDWVVARNAALGVGANLTGAAGEAAKTGVASDLRLVAEQISGELRKGDAGKRAAASAAWKARLRWTSWDDIR